MTVNELIKALQELPEDVRELPAVLWVYGDRVASQVFVSSTTNYTDPHGVAREFKIDCVVLT